VKDTYKVGKYEAPVETLSISMHWPKSIIGTMKVQCICMKQFSSSTNHFEEIVMLNDPEHGDYLHQTHDQRNSNHNDLKQEETYLKLDGDLLCLQVSTVL